MALTVASTNYFAVHARVRRHFGTPSICEFCGRTDAKRFEWAIKHGCEMNDERSSWFRLCTSCHRRYDQTDEWRANNAAARQGKTLTDEHRSKIGAWRPTDEQKERHREGIRRRWEAGGDLRERELTDDDRLKLAEAGRKGAAARWGTPC